MKLITEKITWVIAFLTLFISVSTASAGPLDNSLGERALNIAKSIESDNTILHDSLKDYLVDQNRSETEQLAIIRTFFMNSLQGATQSELEGILQTYTLLADKSGNLKDQEIARMFDAVTKLHHVNLSEAQKTNIQKQMGKFLESDDWFVKHHANILRYEYQTLLSNPSSELQKSQETFLLIPTQDNLYVQEAKLLSSGEMAFIYSSMKNLELSVKNAELQITAHLTTGLPLDGMSVLYNLMYAFTAWGDYQTTISLGETLLRLEEKHHASTPGLTSMRMASVHNKTGEYQIALDYTNMSLKEANLRPIIQASKLNQVMALAGTGNNSEAVKILKALQTENAIPNDSGLSRNILYAQALIELSNGNTLKAIELFNNRLDEEVRHLLKLSNNETQTMLASLQNSEDRRAERETALETQAALKAEALKQEQQKNVALIALLILLAAASVAINSQLRFRAKVAKQLAEAAEAALAGEQAKASFLAVASHELRTPLNGIIGLSDVLTRTAPSPQLRDQNATVLQCGHDLLMTVENMLDMSLVNGNSLKIYPEVMALQRVVKKLENKWRPVIERKNIAFTVHVDEVLPKHLFLDTKRITQCIEILISNAAKFTSSGRVHVHVTSEPAEENSNLHQLKCIVADTGIGIDTDTMEIIFEPFVQADNSMTRQYGGNGLGLSLANYLVEIMDGIIDVNSRDGKGTEVTIVLPVRAPQMLVETQPVQNATSTYMPAPKTMPLLNGKNVLIIEDDLASQNVLKTFLEPEGCSMTCLPNGADAISTLQQRHFDLILMDIRMPGVNGIQTTRNIRRSELSFSQIPIIAVTADVAPETNARCMVAGVDVFLTKPVSARGLFDAIRFVLNQSAQQAKISQIA